LRHSDKREEAARALVSRKISRIRSPS